MERFCYHPTAAGGGGKSLVPEHLRDIESPIAPETHTGLEHESPVPEPLPPTPAHVPSIWDAPKGHWSKDHREYIIDE